MYVNIETIRAVDQQSERLNTQQKRKQLVSVIQQREEKRKKMKERRSFFRSHLLLSSSLLVQVQQQQHSNGSRLVLAMTDDSNNVWGIREHVDHGKFYPLVYVCFYSVFFMFRKSRLNFQLYFVFQLKACRRSYFLRMELD